MPPLVLHVIHHLAIGGMENGLVNLINHMPASRFRHAIACVEEHSEFRQRLTRPDVDVFAFHRSRIGVWRLRKEFFRLCRRLRPTLLHTRNLSGLDALWPARLAGVPYHVHGEHGWNAHDLNGEKWRPALLRLLHSPLVDRYIPVSKNLEQYLIKIGIAASRVSQVYNGVDTERFTPGAKVADLLPQNFSEKGTIVVGSIGRIDAVKDHATLVLAFAELLGSYPEMRKQLRLAIVGDGPLLPDLRRLAGSVGITEVSWFPGAFDTIPEILRAFDVFVLPSLSEGISNTILEAMASGVPVIATAVGGNPELVEQGVCGSLFRPRDIPSLTRSLTQYIADPLLRQAHGRMGRQIAVERFSLARMVANYQSVYESLCYGAALMKTFDELTGPNAQPSRNHQ